MLQFVKEGEEFLGRRKVIDPRRNTENQKYLGNEVSINIRNMEIPFTMYHILALAQLILLRLRLFICKMVITEVLTW